MRRAFGVFFGIITHVIFAITVWRLFGFLKDTSIAARPGTLWIDAALAVFFAVPHSILLLPAVRRRLEGLVPPSHYGCLFCLTTCLTLLLLMSQWRTSFVALWVLEGSASTGMQAGFF